MRLIFTRWPASFRYGEREVRRLLRGTHGEVAGLRYCGAYARVATYSTRRSQVSARPSLIPLERIASRTSNEGQNEVTVRVVSPSSSRKRMVSTTPSCWLKG